MEILYVIGNGFDLWHGLPTKYSDFYKFTEGSLDELEEFFYFEYDGDSLWNNFEEELGKFDWNLFYDAHNHIDVSSESFRPSEAFGLEDDLTEQADNLVEGVRDKFQEWIESIQVEEVEASFNFSRKGRFISFNYTSLLQEVYGIPSNLVFHIHGNSSKYDPLIFGHGESRKEEPELDEEGNSNRTMFSDSEAAAKYPFYAFQKPVLKILNNHHDYFEEICNVDVIVLIGLSLNDIDIPYIERIAKVANGSKWIVSKYTESDEIKHTHQLEKCGVRSDHITFRFIEDIPKELSNIPYK